MLNKPEGYVCSAVSDSHKTVYSLLEPHLQDKVQNAKRGHRLHTVGRLDADSSGLLLITDDGYFSHSVTAPESHVEKTYFVELRMPLTTDIQKIYIEAFFQGLILPPQKKAPEQFISGAHLEFLHTEEYCSSSCLITIQEGRFHQVKRMFLAMGNEVISLKRVSIGKLKLDESLLPGQYRPLSLFELNLLEI